MSHSDRQAHGAGAHCSGERIQRDIPIDRSAPIAVVDFETTGLWPKRWHRVVEVAVVRLGLDGEVRGEFHSLVDPKRDVGATSIHGLSASDLVDAPAFAELLPELVEALDGAAFLAAHNARFDAMFMHSELELAGLAPPPLEWLCTMHLSGGGNLATACERWGVDAGTGHEALADARAAAGILAAMLRIDEEFATALRPQPPIRWPDLPSHPRGSDRRALPRSAAVGGAVRSQHYLATVVARASRHGIAPSAATAAYLDMLDRVLEDRLVTPEEAESLGELATQWRLPVAAIEEAHREYLARLVRFARADGVVTATEHTDLCAVADLLAIDRRALGEMLADPSLASGHNGALPRSELQGRRVCFTGEFRARLGGRPICREVATALAKASGLEVVDRVAKRTPPAWVVVADPHTQSKKAQQAREQGVPIVHERVFWRMLGVAVE